jgi:acyl-CoA hydrolase
MVGQPAGAIVCREKDSIGPDRVRASIRALGLAPAHRCGCGVQITLTVFDTQLDERFGSRIYSRVGGQMDFIGGAALAPEGRAIIALPSTAAGGAVSRIAPVLASGAGVVTTRAHVRTVVTEWGVAELFGRSLHERAAALIEIAHPDHRDRLRSEAHRLGFS